MTDRFTKIISVCFLVLALFPSCAREIIDRPIQDSSFVDFEIRTTSNSDTEPQSGSSTKTYINEPSVNVCWSREDALNLFQIEEGGTYSSNVSSDIIRSDDRYDATFKVRFQEKPGTFRYWAQIVNKEKTGAHDEYWKSHLDAMLSSYPIAIFAEQHPDPSDHDPKTDILVASCLHTMSQSEMASTPISFGLKRLNAFARVNMKNIPSDHKMLKVVFTSDKPIVGTRYYDVLSGKLTEKSELSAEMTAVIEGDLQDVAYDSRATRRIHFSLWPCEIGHYDILVTTVDKAGKTHHYGKTVDRSEKHLKFESGRMTEWGVSLVERIPDNPDDEKVIEGNVDPSRTIEIYRKLKKDPSNGINYIDTWKTHLLGYDGVQIHEAKMMQYNSPVHLWIVEVDPLKADFVVGSPNDEMTVPFKSKQTVLEQAKSVKRSGKEVLVAINGDAWYDSGNGHYPYGVMWKDGRCLKSTATKANDLANQDVFYVTENGEFDIVNYYSFINTDGGGGIVQNKKVRYAVGGWYRLICMGGDSAAQPGARDGDAFIRDKSKVSENLKNFLSTNPRTFMGITSDRVYLIVADGRRDGWSVGLTMNGAARICHSLGCRRAVNLDGGGSSTLVKRWKGGFTLMNRPTDADGQRPVVNSLMVVGR